ncbi:NADH-quinone oxidoreductase subunit C [Microlunatus flavus]|uniref:NADH-quinone oxidoreductase subunit C n=1 Tax=Microlunatus flavus TaxID=1036181 RepID=A0A1H9LWV9_9ACTN|nr:NADH-quinone oxidoreductase subunit C [Microlunatus flavus]
MSGPTNADNAKATSDAAQAEKVTGESDANAPVKGAVPEGESAPDRGTEAGSKTGSATPVSTASTDAAEDRAETEQVEQGETAVATTQRDTEVLRVQHGMFGVKGSGDTSGYGGLSRVIDFPAAGQPPYGGWWDEVHERMTALSPNSSDIIEKVVVHRGEITFHVVRSQLATLARHLRDDPHLRFEFCSSVSGVHYPGDAGRELHAVYHLQSMTYNRRIRLEVSVPDADPHIPSVVPTYPGADWHERETYDMFGIVFDGHPALTRILMPDDWPGHPQRKDYPLGGIDVEYHGASVPPPDQRRTYS